MKKSVGIKMNRIWPVLCKPQKQHLPLSVCNSPLEINLQFQLQFTGSQFLHWNSFVIISRRNQQKKKINAGLCCLGYSSEILRDRPLITSSMYNNFRRRTEAFFLRVRKGVLWLVHKVRGNRWILIAAGGQQYPCWQVHICPLKSFPFHLHSLSLGCRGPDMHTKTHICWKTSFFISAYTHTLSAPTTPPFSGPNKHYHPSMSAHRLICCLSPCRELALVRHKATHGNSSLSPKHLVWQLERGKRGGAGGERGDTDWRKEGEKVKQGEKRMEEKWKGIEISVWSLFKPTAPCLYRTSKSEILPSLTVIDSLALTVASRGLQLYKCLFCSAVLKKDMLHQKEELQQERRQKQSAV